MANGQIDHLIQDATDRLAEKGQDADLRDVMLAGFGYVVSEVRKPHNLLGGKKGALAGGSIVAVLAGVIEVIRGVFGG